MIEPTPQEENKYDATKEQPPKQEESWEKEFDEIYIGSSRTIIKDFIRNLLAKERDRILMETAENERKQIRQLLAREYQRGFIIGSEMAGGQDSENPSFYDSFL